MCLILFSLQHHPRYPLIIAANRDELHNRPTAPLGFWPDAPDIIGGRDLAAGGSWLGITRQGRWAALTNFRQAVTYRETAPSRGRLVSEFLQGTLTPVQYIERLQPIAREYNGFNLLVGDLCTTHYLSNREDRGRPVSLGIHGLSNHLLDTPWRRVELGKQALQSLPDGPAGETTEILLACLRNSDASAHNPPPRPSAPEKRERALSPPFIVSDVYGTRASTVILVDSGGNVSIEERAFGPSGVPKGTAAFEFALTSVSAEQVDAG